MKVYLASDHAGYKLKNTLCDFLKKEGHNPIDLGPSSSDRVDYPDFAKKLCLELQGSACNSIGILVCGSGQGMAMAANKFAHIRAGLCSCPELAELAKAHNNANVLCLGARFLDEETAAKITSIFLKTPFEGGRHLTRIQKITSS